MFDRKVASFGAGVDAELEAERFKTNGNPRRRLEQLLRDDEPGERQGMSLDQLVDLTRHTAKVTWD